jgi:protein TonB
MDRGTFLPSERNEEAVEETALHLTVSGVGTRSRSRSRSMVSFLTASLLQLGGFAVLVMASLLDVSLPPPPQVRPLGLVVGVTPPASVPVRVVAPVRRRGAPRAPSVSRYEWVAPPFIPDQILDSVGWDDAGTTGSASGDDWGWGPIVGAPPETNEVAGPEPIRPGGRIQPPKKTRHVDPDYPKLARAAGIEGVVILEAIIDPTGRVQDVRVLRSIPFLDDAAVAAVERWEYEPTLLNGVPVPVVVTVTVRFVSERRR